MAEERTKKRKEKAGNNLPHSEKQKKKKKSTSDSTGGAMAAEEQKKSVKKDDRLAKDNAGNASLHLESARKRKKNKKKRSEDDSAMSAEEQQSGVAAEEQKEKDALTKECNGEMATEDASKAKRRRLADEVTELKGLEIYWKLPSMDSSERQAAALALVKELRAAQEAFEAKGGHVENGADKILLGEERFSSWAPELQYALPRLIRGVGSSNQCARQGFASALTSVIIALPSVTGDSILKLIDKEIEVSSSIKGQELRDGLLGRLFAYASIVRSERLIGNGTTEEQQKLAVEVGQRLLALGFKKSFLREPAVAVFLELTEKLALSTLQETLFTMPIFQEWLTASPESGGADALLLALKLWRKLPDGICSKCPMLPKSKSIKDLFQTSHLEVVLPYLKESTSSHPRVHLVWEAIAGIFSEQDDSNKKKNKRSKNNENAGERCLISFWSRVVDQTFIGSSHERKFLAMRLVILFLSKLTASYAPPIILTVRIGRCLLDIFTTKNSVLYSSAQQFLSELCSWAEQSQDRLIFTIGFLQQSSCGRFDHITKTSNVKRLMGKVANEASCLSGIQNLQRLFISDIPGNDDEDAKIIASKKIWMVELMSGLCKQATSVSGSKSAAKQVTRFLAAHALLEAGVLNRNKLSGLVECAADLVSKHVKEECVAKLRALLSTNINAKPKEAGQDEDLAYDLVEFFQPALETNSKIITRLQTAIIQITKAIKKGKNVGKLTAMRSLLSQMVIEACLVPSSVDDITTELLICCNKEFGTKVNLGDDEIVSDDEAPAVADVLLDVILSILSQSSGPLRIAAEQLFGCISGEITPSGLNSMLKVMGKQVGNTRHEQIFDLQNEGDDDEDVLSVEEVSEPEEDGNEPSEDEEEMEEDEEGEKQVVFTSSRKQADEGTLQGAMDDDDELSDMDDDAMFRMDDHLSQIIRLRKRGDTDAQTQLVQFKFRVLGLIETYLHKQTENIAVLTILPVLFQAMLNATAEGNIQLAGRISSVLTSKVLKAKSYPKGQDVDIPLVKDLLEKIVRVASKTTEDKVRTLAQGVVLWLIKVSQTKNGAPDDEIVEVMSSAVDDILGQRKTNLPLSFFHEAAVRFPWLGKIIIGKLVRRCRDARTDFAKVEAMDLLSSLLKLYLKQQNTDSDLASFIRPHLTELSEVLKLYFEKPMKKTRQVSFVKFCISCLKALKVLFPKEKLNKLINVEEIKTGVDGFTCADKSKLKSLKTEVQGLLRA